MTSTLDTVESLMSTLDQLLDACSFPMGSTRRMSIERYEYSGKGILASYGFAAGDRIYEASMLAIDSAHMRGYGASAPASLVDLMAKVRVHMAKWVEGKEERSRYEHAQAESWKVWLAKSAG